MELSLSREANSKDEKSAGSASPRYAGSGVAATALTAIILNCSVLVTAQRASAAPSPSLGFASPAQTVAYIGSRFAFEPYARVKDAPQFGGPTFQLVGTLPTGLRWSPRTGISGTPAPSTAGSYQIRFVAREADAAPTTQSFRLTVARGPSPAPLPSLVPKAAAPSSGRAPTAISFAQSTDHTVLDNDTLGDCVEAAEAHLAEDQAAAIGSPVPPVRPTSVITAYYELTGGRAGPDVGTNDWQAFALWRRAGLGSTHLVSVARLTHPHNRHALELAIAELGGVLAYVKVPSVDRPGGGVTAGGIWRADAGSSAHAQLPHELAVVGYNPIGPLLSTWGRVQQATWSWWADYAVGVYPVITAALLRAGHGPSGLPIRTLLQRWAGSVAPAHSAPPRAAPY